MSREATNKVLELVEEGVLDPQTVILACLKYMSEDDVADMAHINGFFEEEEEEKEPYSPYGDEGFDESLISEGESEDESEYEDSKGDDEPSPDDYVLYPCSRLGGMTCVSQVEGRGELGKFSSDQEAIDFVKKRMEKEKYWPNVWWQDDHGGVSLVTLGESSAMKEGDEGEDDDASESHECESCESSLPENKMMWCKEKNMGMCHACHDAEDCNCQFRRGRGRSRE